MDSFTLQTGSGQDYSGHATVNGTSFCFVFDGHGRNDCIQFIRTLDMHHFALQECPPTAIEKAFEGKDFYRSGATFVLARIHQNTLEVFHVGDAKAQVFVNGNMVHETIDHTFLEPDEIKRTTAKIRHDKAPFPINDKEVELQESPLGCWPNGETFVPSQALGHNGISGLSPGYFKLEFDTFDTIRVVGGSDGNWDMLPKTNGTAKELCEHAVQRWKQPWIFNGTVTTYGDSIDDVSVAILDNTVAIPPVICIPYSLSIFTKTHLLSSFPLTVHRIDEVAANHKIFFLHLVPTRDPLLRNIRDKKVRLYYHDDWFWHLTLHTKHYTLLEQEFIDSGRTDYDAYIPSYAIQKMKAYISNFS